MLIRWALARWLMKAFIRCLAGRMRECDSTCSDLLIDSGIPSMTWLNSRWGMISNVVSSCWILFQDRLVVWTNWVDMVALIYSCWLKSRLTQSIRPQFEHKPSRYVLKLIASATKLKSLYSLQVFTCMCVCMCVCFLFFVWGGGGHSIRVYSNCVQNAVRYYWT